MYFITYSVTLILVLQILVIFVVSPSQMMTMYKNIQFKLLFEYLVIAILFVHSIILHIVHLIWFQVTNLDYVNTTVCTFVMVAYTLMYSKRVYNQWIEFKLYFKD